MILDQKQPKKQEYNQLRLQENITELLKIPVMIKLNRNDNCAPEKEILKFIT